MHQIKIYSTHLIFFEDYELTVTEPTHLDGGLLGHVQ